MTARQRAKMEQLARRWGCYPDDMRVVKEHGGYSDVIIGEHKGRPKALRIYESGRTERREHP